MSTVLLIQIVSDLTRHSHCVDKLIQQNVALRHYNLLFGELVRVPYDHKQPSLLQKLKVIDRCINLWNFFLLPDELGQLLVHILCPKGVLCRLRILIQEVSIEAHLEMLQDTVGSMLLWGFQVHIFYNMCRQI